MDEVAETAAWLRAERHRLDWSTTELARRIRELSTLLGDPLTITQQTISYFETGKAKSIPRWMRLVRILVDLEALSLTDRDAATANLLRTGGISHAVDASTSDDNYEQLAPSQMRHEAKEWVTLLSCLDRIERDAVLQLARTLANRHAHKFADIPLSQGARVLFHGTE